MTSPAFFKANQRPANAELNISRKGNYIINYITKIVPYSSVKNTVVEINYIINYITTTSPLSLSQQVVIGGHHG